MATTDDLVISIRADIGALQSQLRNIDAQLRGTERQGNETANAIKNMALQFISLGAAIEGMKKLVDVNRNFGILKAGLETATGSIEGANQAFAALQQFAQTTPYSLQQAVDGFTKLVNLGLTPSEAALKSYGDTSAALGKDLSQMIEAVADAATGEFERLKEFGIKAKNNGDSIAFTFKGTTETVRNNAAEIESYLIKLGQVNFDGAMTKRMESLDGAISNLSDSWDAFFYNLGQAGATDVLKDAFNAITDAINEVNSMLSSGEMESYIDAIGISFSGLAEDVAQTTAIIEQWVSDNKENTGEFFTFFKNAFLELPQNIRAFVQIATVEFAHVANVAVIYGQKIANALNPMSPSYNLKQNLDAAVQAYNDSINQILAERDRVTKEAENKRSEGKEKRVMDDLLNGFLKENSTDGLSKFGVKKDQTPQVDDKKAAQEAKKLEQLKSAANAYLNQIAESNMSELQLEAKHFNEQLQQLEKYLQQTAITKSQYDAAVLDANSAFINKIYEQQLEQQAKEDKLALKKQEREDEDRSRRMGQIQGIINEANLAGMTELERMDAQHAAKMEKLAQLAEGESQFKQELRDAELILEQEHQTKRLDMILGTGSKIQNMTNAFQKGQLQGAVSFFAADFGGLSQHSRKLFELTKAARLAEAAINIPSTVMAAAKHGSEIGGWPLGLAMGAAALASQLSQLKAIQSASFGGGSSGAGGGGASASSVAQSQQPQQPLQQRFVNLNLYGGDNTMYSKDSVRTLIQRIGEEVKDGAVLRVS
jgi:hypothetical protein